MIKRSPFFKKPAFTMIELVFVIVIMGILSKFGIELLAQAYQNFLYTKINNKLQNQSATAVEFVAKRLSYRIPDSVIGRENNNSYDGIQELVNTKNYVAVEWIARDMENWRGLTKPAWSGIADLNASSNSTISTPDTNITEINTTISVLSDSNSSIADAAIYFIGSNSDANSSYGWQGSAVSNVGAAVHHITSATTNSLDGNFSNVDLYEYYQLAWTANAVSLEDDGKGNGTYDLMYHYNYQPWLGERYNSPTTKKQVIMENVPTFQFRAVGSMIKVQVCVKSDLINNEEGYALCKEKTIF